MKLISLTLFSIAQIFHTAYLFHSTSTVYDSADTIITRSSPPTIQNRRRSGLVLFRLAVTHPMLMNLFHGVRKSEMQLLFTKQPKQINSTEKSPKLTATLDQRRKPSGTTSSPSFVGRVRKIRRTKRPEMTPSSFETRTLKYVTR